MWLIREGAVLSKMKVKMTDGTSVMPVETKETRNMEGEKTNGPIEIDFEVSSLYHITLVKLARKSVTVAMVMRERRLKLDQLRLMKIENHKLSFKKLEQSRSPNSRVREVEHFSKEPVFEKAVAEEQSDVNEKLLILSFLSK